MNRLFKFHNKESGFTLLELLIALFVMAFGMLGVVGMMLISVKGNAYGKRMMEATAMAQDKIEELRNQGYPFLYAGCGIAPFPDPCNFTPGAMKESAAPNDGGSGGDALTGGAGDGIWTYEYASPPAAQPLPAGMRLVWGVRRNYPQPRLIWMVSIAQWTENLGTPSQKTHTARVESVRGSFD